MPTARRMLKLTPAEAVEMKAHAATVGASMSGLGRAWIEDFLENGSDIPEATEERIEILVDRDILKRAMAKARDEYGVDLSQILRHKIASLRQ